MGQRHPGRVAQEVAEVDSQTGDRLQSVSRSSRLYGAREGSRMTGRFRTGSRSQDYSA